MSDPTVRETAKRLDDEARAEKFTAARVNVVKYWLDQKDFNYVSEITEHDFIDWYADRYEDGGYDWVDNCHVTSSWYYNGVEVDTEAVATAFVDWIGD